MDTLGRRTFLKRTILAGGGLALPGWMAAAFGPGRPDEQDGKPAQQEKEKELDRAHALRAAHRRAASRGKPLLVFVVPDNQNARYDRGGRLGALLNHGGREVLFDLACCELACATVAEIRTEFGFDKLSGEPLMLCIELPTATTQAKAPTCAAIEVPKTPFPQRIAGRGSSEEQEKRYTAHEKREVQKVAAALHKVIAPDPGALGTRADRVRSRLAADEREAIESYVATGKPLTTELCVHAAPILRVAALAPRRKGDGKRILDTLEKAATETILKRRIAGSKWAKTFGCGSTIEGEQKDAPGVACGMGRVTPLANRFLWFFTR
ncbi:MAG: hypothetical protein H6837_06625 [Planctomycetes bacterium]|nr:hypothetical protein [Planctomycetota bacterium]